MKNQLIGLRNIQSYKKFLKTKMNKKSANIKQLKGISKKIRQNILKMIIKAKSGDLSGSLGATDIFCALYFGDVLNCDSKRPNIKDRDKVILSDTHICPALYATLAEAGYFPKRELWSFRNFGSALQGHAVYKSIAGVENPSPSFGQGLSVAVGMAYAMRYFEKSNQMVYCVSSDEELNQGQTWEAIMFAAKHKLPNLTMIINRDNIQSDGNTEEIMPIEPLKDKYKAFNWKVINVDGNDINEIIQACIKAREIHEKPVCIIANTISGKGIKFLESGFKWNEDSLQENEIKDAFKSLGIKV